MKIIVTILMILYSAFGTTQSQWNVITVKSGDKTYLQVNSYPDNHSTYAPPSSLILSNLHGDSPYLQMAYKPEPKTSSENVDVDLVEFYKGRTIHFIFYKPYHVYGHRFDVVPSKVSKKNRKYIIGLDYPQVYENLKKYNRVKIVFEGAQYYYLLVGFKSAYDIIKAG